MVEANNLWTASVSKCNISSCPGLIVSDNPLIQVIANMLLTI